MPRFTKIMILALASFATMILRSDAFKQRLSEGEHISNGEYLLIPDNTSLVPSWLAMQRDCNFVLYNQVGRPAWNSVTYEHGLAGSCFATVKDCILQVYDGFGDAASNVLWKSPNTATPAAPPCYATILLSDATPLPLPAVLLSDSAGNVQWRSPASTSPSSTT